MTEYPARVKSWTARRDLQDLVVAADVNTLYDEVTAIEQNLGAGGVAVSPTWGSNSFDSATLVWNNLHDRLINIEAGTYTAYTSRVNVAGGSTIQPSSTTTTGLILKAVSSQTSNLLEVRSSSNAVIASVDASGKLIASVIDGGTA
jgi:hypothetical protein